MSENNNKAPAYVPSPMMAHGSRFVPRSTIQDYKDRLYHEKPEINYAGKQYRKPKQVIQLHTLANIGRGPVPLYQLRGWVAEYFEAYGEWPTRLNYPGRSSHRYYGLDFSERGVYVGILLVGGSEDMETSMEYREEDRPKYGLQGTYEVRR